FTEAESKAYKTTLKKCIKLTREQGTVCWTTNLLLACVSTTCLTRCDTDLPLLILLWQTESLLGRAERFISESIICSEVAKTVRCKENIETTTPNKAVEDCSKELLS